MREYGVIKKRILAIICVVTFPVLAIMLCKVVGTDVLNIYLPAGWCSDEVSYYKQIEAMIEYGMPGGYWGYNESTARIGTFGHWTVLGFIPYYIIGKLLGWTFLTPIICNLFFMSMASLAWYALSRPTPEQVIGWIMLSASLPVLCRYSLAAMLEALIVAMGIVLVGLTVKAIYYSTNVECILGIIYLIVFLLTIPRPYFIVFMFIPCLVLWGNKKYVLISAALSVLSAFFYFLSDYLWCAPYYSVSNHDLFGNFGKVVNYIITRNAGEGGMVYGYGYLFMVAVIMISGVNIILCRKKSIEARMSAYLMGCVIAVFCSILFLYEPAAGCRHIFQFCVVVEFFLFAFERRHVKFFQIGINIVVFMIYIKSADYMFSIPTEANMQREIPDNFESVFQYEEDRWQNTVAINVDTVDYNIAYYLPSYLGIQIVQEDYLKKHNLQSSYIMSGIDQDIGSEGNNTAYRMIYRDEEQGVCIYRK